MLLAPPGEESARMVVVGVAAIQRTDENIGVEHSPHRSASSASS